MKNIFLTGERGVGKTTIINRLAKTLDYVPGGYQTFLSGKGEGGPETVIIRPFGAGSTCNQGLARDGCFAMAAVRDKETGLLRASRDAFDVFGAGILGRSRKLGLPGLIIMDELGFLEEGAYLFQEEVFRCLDDKTSVLGVMKAVSNPFLDLIRERDDVCIIEVTLENREQVFTMLCGTLEERNKRDGEKQNEHI